MTRKQRGSSPELSYFEIQAHMGTTKHMGGLETTQALIEMCRIGSGSYVLDVGCGVGATPCYLARTLGCPVVGVDLREAMIDRSRERARREGVEDKVEFRVADVRDLPFEEGTYDVVLCESVATFIEEKQRAIDEIARVAKPGGYVGLNEELWLEPPPPEVVKQVQRVWEIRPPVPSLEDWMGWLAGAELRDIEVRCLKLGARREATQVKRYRARDMVEMFWRTLSLWVSKSEFRDYVRKQRRLPMSTFKYLGHALFVARKGAG